MTVGGEAARRRSTPYRFPVLPGPFPVGWLVTVGPHPGVVGPQSGVVAAQFAGLLFQLDAPWRRFDATIRNEPALAPFAQRERTYMRELAAHARAVATAKDQRVGRPSVVNPNQLDDARRLRDEGDTIDRSWPRPASPGPRRTGICHHVHRNLSRCCQLRRGLSHPARQSDLVPCLRCSSPGGAAWTSPAHLGSHGVGLAQVGLDQRVDIAGIGQPKGVGRP